MSKLSVLLANEAGAGRGHVTLLAGVARALGTGVEVHAAIPSLRHALELDPAQVERGPLLRYAAAARQDSALAGNATWGDYLAACGLASPEIVRAHLRWWRRKIVQSDASLLIADYAPLALWAAQGLKAEGWAIKTLSVGTGYGLPPARMERFPQLLPDFARQTITEDAVLATLNAVAASEGLEPLQSFPAIAQADTELAFTFDYLDPYASWRNADDYFVPVLSPLPPLGTDRGSELFIYFSRQELEEDALLDAVAGLPVPKRGFFPGASSETLERLRQGGVIVETGAIPMAEIAARARLILSAGQHGIHCMAALAGLPQVAVPQHLEQLFTCRQSDARGGTRHVPLDGQTCAAITDTILAAWSDTALYAAARAVATDLRMNYPADPMARLSARLAPLIDQARRAYP
jgi:hypothetical protein